MGTFCTVVGLAALIIVFNIIRHVWEINAMMAEVKADEKREGRGKGPS